MNNAQLKTLSSRARLFPRGDLLFFGLSVREGNNRSPAPLSNLAIRKRIRGGARDDSFLSCTVS
jgi:hypothetical protein